MATAGISDASVTRISPAGLGPGQASGDADLSMLLGDCQP